MTSRHKCALVCPRCGTYWADLKYKYGSHVKPSDVHVYVGKSAAREDGTMCCGDCGYEYMTSDVWLAIAEPNAPKIKPGEKLAPKQEEKK